MSQKFKNYESPPSYMDGLCVKISEKYKPPKRISLPMSCVQKTSSNEIIQSLSAYDFNLELNLCAKMRELRAARKSLSDERRERASKARQKNDWEKEVRKMNNADEKLATTDIPNTDSVSYPNMSEIEPTVGRSLSPCSAMLFSSPVYVSRSSNILIPVQTTDSFSNDRASLQKYEYSKINISDFENDTSSPFDNMELKTLNDFEELAQVLQTNVKVPSVQKANATAYTPYESTVADTSQFTSYSDYNNYNSAYSFDCSRSTADSRHRQINGFNYIALPTPASSSQYNYEYLNHTHPLPVSIPEISSTEIVSETKSKSRSVPDIMKALEKELRNCQLDEMKKSTDDQHLVSPEIHKNFRADIEKSKSDELDNPFHIFNSETQNTIKEVSQMGFPLPRVARAFSAVGNDREKVVEHLITMTQLLDLGFPERDVAKALIQFNNDRDKALDSLIS